ncbi:MAG: hypothetical protein WBW74_14865 [Xanthobacteraceae bacterium]
MDNKKTDAAGENKIEAGASILNPAVSALLEQSGEIAPVELGRFGRRAGEIIAGATAPRYDRGRRIDRAR